MSSLDQVILVNEHDQEIGVMDKVEAHLGEGKLHRAISVYLFNKEGKLLLQQRSPEKITAGLQWGNTCCGNVRPNETYEECAYRRLREELGITNVEIKPITKFQYHVKCDERFSEHEIDTIFMGFYDGDVTPNPHEVADIQWVSKDELMGLAAKDRQSPQPPSHPNTLVPWLHIMIDRKLVPIFLYGNTLNA